MEHEGNKPASIATLLRLAADGELSEQQEAALRAHLEAHPEDRARVDFDRKLRDACGCACVPDCCAPESLRQRVLACCSQAVDGDAPNDPRLAARLDARAAETRESGFWSGRTIARFGTIAAVIALVGIVGYMVGRSTPVGPGGQPSIRTVEERISNFVRSEHNRCAKSSPDIGKKFDIDDPQKLPAVFESIIGQPFSLACVLDADDHGLRFVDAGRCYPPGGDAIHVRFVTDDEAASPVSLWIQKDDDSLPMEDGITYTAGEGCDCVRFWRVDGVRYVLISSQEQAGPRASLALHSPETVRPF
ncbi:MAG: anti-sigma factor family protein [Phycisphaerales bacterium JB041]